MKVIVGISPTENQYGLAIVLLDSDGKKHIAAHDVVPIVSVLGLNPADEEEVKRVQVNVIHTHCDKLKKGLTSEIDRVIISRTGGDAASVTRVAFKRWAEKNDIPCEILNPREINDALQLYQDGLDIRNSEFCRLWLQDQRVVSEIPKEKAAAASACLVALSPLLRPKQDGEPVSEPDNIVLHPLKTNKHHEAVVCDSLVFSAN